MKRILVLAKRNLSETLKDYVSLIFILGFPVIMLVFMQTIFDISVESPSFMLIENFAPGICVFAFTFVMLYDAIIISLDKNGAFMMRILISPVKEREYLVSFFFSSILIMFLQTLLFYVISLFYGLPFGGRWILSIASLIPAMFLFSSMGIIIGVIAKSEKQSGPLCSVFISGTCILGGVFMPIDSVSHGLYVICKILPFYNSVSLGRDAFVSLSTVSLGSFFITVGWTVALFISAVLIFKYTIKK